MFNKDYDKLADRIMELGSDAYLSNSEVIELISALSLKDAEDARIKNGISGGCNHAPMIPSGPVNLPIKGFTPEGDPILDKTAVQINGPVPNGVQGHPNIPGGPLMSPSPMNQFSNPFTNS